MPKRLSLELAGVAAILFLVALCARQQERLAARPRVEEKVQIVRVSGPSRVVTKYLDGKVVERVRTVESVRYEKVAERTETPVGPSFKTRYAGLGIDGVRWQQPDLRAGMTVLGVVDVGGRVNPWRKSIGLEAAWRF